MYFMIVLHKDRRKMKTTFKMFIFLCIFSVVTFSELTNGCSASHVLAVGNHLLLRGTGVREGGTVDVVLLWKGV